MDKTLISGDGLKKRYLLGQREVWALNGVSFKIDRGEFVALIGRSGSGKTTLLNLIGGLDTPSTGELKIDNQSLGIMSDDELTAFRGRNIGYVFQTFNLIPVLTVIENVEYPLIHAIDVAASARQERAREILGRMGLEGDLIYRRPSQLSGGQRQRVAIARALVHNPKLVMADEPTANLDSATAKEILDLMFSLNQELGQTFVVASHDPVVIKRAHRVIELTDGVAKS